jgi:protein O-mannosyl-transferase
LCYGASSFEAAMSCSNGKDENSTTGARQTRQFWLLAGLLVCATLALYLQSIDFDFVSLDDPVYVSENGHIKGGLTASNIAWSFDGFHYVGNWIPFTWLSLMLDSELHGSAPGGYHMANVLLHAANSVLVLTVLARATGDQLRSAFVAGVFALHPLHVESVAWITERKDVLSIFFGLLSLLAYVNYAQRKRGRSLVLSFAWFLCSLLSKPTLVTLPFLLLLLDFWPLRRFETGHLSRILRSSVVRLLIEKLPFLAVSAVFSAITKIALRSTDWNVLSMPSSLPLTARLMNAVVAYAAYLEKAVVPHDLAVFYPHPGISLAWTSAAAAAGLLAAISLAAIVWIRRCPFVFVGWAWYLGTLVPMIGIVQGGAQQMADRFMYFPSIGLALAVAWLVPELLPAGGWRTRLLPVAALAALSAFGAATFVQIGYWRDGLTLLRHALACQPNDPFIRDMLGDLLVSQGKVDEGLVLLESAARIPPPSSRAHFSLAVALHKMGRTDEAAEEYRRAIAIDDSNPQAQGNLAVILCQRGEYQVAKQHLLRSIEIDSRYAFSYASLGAVYMAIGDNPRAIEYSEQALQLDPDLASCHDTIAKALRAEGESPRAAATAAFELR